MPAILSVGIDIGTSTTQVIFSQLMIDNTAGYFSAPEISIIDKKVIYKSEIYFTPLIKETLIDGDGVRNIVAEEYKKAGFVPADVDTGAVIITGESARKENAALVLEKLSNFAGDFVVSTAGADLESLIAGKGSGAYQYSIDHECSVVNLDIGGGTTNIVQFYAGEVVGKSCFDIGGRLIRLADDGTLISICSGAKKIAEYYGIRLEAGKRAAEENLSRICEKMSEILAQALWMMPQESLIQSVHTENSSWLDKKYPIEKICFSGGVADCIYHPFQEDKYRFGDIGILLGDAIRKSCLYDEKYRIPAGETIRATVVGAGMYATNLSGSTIYYDEGIFPTKNVPVLKIAELESEENLKETARWFLEQSDSASLILAIRGLQDPEYYELKNLANKIWEGLDPVLEEDIPIIVVVEHDIAKALGTVIKRLAGDKRPIAVIDGIKVDVNDFVDIGYPCMDGMVVPVIIKTLLFG